jgi:sulfoxide reductase heme-binding subunit YedZ
MNRRLLFRIGIHILGWTPLILLLFHALTNNLTVNPIQEITKRLGRAAILMLFLSLSGTPLANLSGWGDFSRHRRTLGLYSFSYALSHLLIFAGIDYGLNFVLISQQIIKKPYIILGSVAISLLTILAISSFKPVIRFMGSYWKKVHRLVYIIAILTIIHYGFAVKGNLFGLTGDIWKPLLYSLFFLVLMILRLPGISRRLKKKRGVILRMHDNIPQKNPSIQSGEGISL